MKLTRLILFLRQLIIHPKSIGAAFPSSSKLADVIAQQIVLEKNNFVVELGGGTGAITASLLRHAIPTDKLIVIERLPALAQHLQKRFPQVRIIQGDATELNKLLDASILPVSAIASSLPMRSLLSLSTATIKAIGEQIDEVLTPNGIFVQFTYGLLSTPLSPSSHLQHLYSKYVWCNFPPARVDIFRMTMKK